MLTIHPISPHERAVFSDMARRYLLEIAPHSPEAEAMTKDNASFEEVFPFAAPGHFPWWAQVGLHQIGFALILLSDGGLEHRSAWLTDVFLEPAWRRQGYGRAFIEALKHWMKSQNVSRIDLSVRSDTPGAYAFWKAVGFQLDSYRMSQTL